MSVPFGKGSNGMPIGVQILAPPMQEPVMYQVAHALEMASE